MQWVVLKARTQAEDLDALPANSGPFITRNFDLRLRLRFPENCSI